MHQSIVVRRRRCFMCLDPSHEKQHAPCRCQLHAGLLHAEQSQWPRDEGAAGVPRNKVRGETNTRREEQELRGEEGLS